jgi:putative resolvase
VNGARRKVQRLLADPRVATVVVEHRDRLGRMNTELVEAALSAHGRRAGGAGLRGGHRRSGARHG